MNDPRQPISVGAMFSDATTNLGIDLTTGRNYELDTLFYSMAEKLSC